jgi:Flp pilus assembly protein TadG
MSSQRTWVPARARAWVAARRRRLRDESARPRALADRMLGDTRGAVAVLFAVAAIPLIGFVGMGVDGARSHIVRSRLSAAVDAAALAGGNRFFSATRDDDIRMYFHANFPSGYLGAQVTGPVIAADPVSQTLTVSASAILPTTFMHVLGSDPVVVATSAEVTRRMRAMDVVLSIDVSGSMGTRDRGQRLTRLEATKQAANELVDILFGADSRKDLLKIGLVPWSSKVNVMIEGEAFSAGLTTTVAVPSFTAPDLGRVQSQIYYANNSPVPLLERPPADWKGCVFNRYTDNKRDDDDGDIRDGTFSGGGTTWAAWAPVLPGDYPDAAVAAVWGGEPVAGTDGQGRALRCALAPSGNECGPCPTVGITPLQQEKAVIVDAIDDLAAGGNTNVPAGLGWAWRVLTTIPPFEHTDSVEYEPLRAIVLMTDGENCATYGDGYKAVFGLCGDTSRDAMNERAVKLAANIKASGVIIYVVQFVAHNETLENFLKTVASGRETPYYYYAPDAGALSEAFHEIANNLSELRLSK